MSNKLPLQIHFDNTNNNLFSVIDTLKETRAKLESKRQMLKTSLDELNNARTDRTLTLTEANYMDNIRNQTHELIAFMDEFFDGVDDLMETD